MGKEPKFGKLDDGFCTALEDDMGLIILYDE
jgi:hypothetical protein